MSAESAFQRRRTELLASWISHGKPEAKFLELEAQAAVLAREQVEAAWTPSYRVCLVFLNTPRDLYATRSSFEHKGAFDAQFGCTWYMNVHARSGTIIDGPAFVDDFGTLRFYNPKGI